MSFSIASTKYYLILNFQLKTIAEVQSQEVFSNNWNDQDQVYDKIQRYIKMGIRSFIFSGYPHKQEAEYFAELVLPRLKTVSLPEVLGRIPTETPKTPLEKGPRT